MLYYSRIQLDGINLLVKEAFNINKNISNENIYTYFATEIFKEVELKGTLSAKIVNFCYPSDMIDALIKRVSVTYKCYEMYAHRGKKVQLLMF